MILASKNKRLAYLLGALMLMLTASAVWAQILDVTGSPNQLGIAAVYLTAPGNSLGAPVPCFNGDSSPSRYLNFVGKNFNTGNSPKLLIDLGVVGPYTNWSNLTPVDTNAATLAGGPYYVQIDCSQFSILSIHRLVVSTGNGPVYNDAVSFDFSVVGPRGLVGAAGAVGATGGTGATGANGNAGAKGDTGPKGETGPQGNTGSQGNGGAKGDTGPQGNGGPKGETGPQGNGGPKGETGSQGNNGARGPQGPPGNAFGYHRKFGTADITGTSTTVLSQVVTGSNSYIVDAKLNAPFANGQKQVSCTLVAAEDGVSTELDRLDTLLLGNQQNTARGSFSLNGVFTAAGPLSSVTITVNCATGGDNRTLSNGRMSIIGVNVLVP